MTAKDLEKVLIESAISFGMNTDKESNKRTESDDTNLPVEEEKPSETTAE